MKYVLMLKSKLSAVKKSIISLCKKMYIEAKIYICFYWQGFCVAFLYIVFVCIGALAIWGFGNRM